MVEWKVLNLAFVAGGGGGGYGGYNQPYGQYSQGGGSGGGYHGYDRMGGTAQQTPTTPAEQPRTDYPTTTYNYCKQLMGL